VELGWLVVPLELPVLLEGAAVPVVPVQLERYCKQAARQANANILLYLPG
jgi:hypothetical protein